MTSRRSRVWVPLVAAALAGTSTAGELKAKQRWDEIERGMKGERDEVVKNCGKDIPDSIDKKSFKDDLYRRVGPASCFEMIKAVHSICHPSYPDRNKIVLKKIKKMVCRYGGPLEASVKKAMNDSPKPYDVPGSEQDLKIKDGTFTWTMHYDPDTEFIVFSRGDSLLQDISAYLEKAL